MSIQGWVPLGLTLQSKGLSRVFSSSTIQRHQYFATQPFFIVQLSTSIHDYWKNHNFDYMDLHQQSDVSAFEYVVQVCHSFPSKEQASFNVMATVTIHSYFGGQENKICHCFLFFPPYSCHVMGPDAMIFVFFECWVLSQLFHSPLSPSSRGSSVPLPFLPLENIVCISETADISPSNLDFSL